jgi:hypothetical protein
MTVGISSAAAIDHLTDWGATYTYAQLHTGDPGPAGTANVAAETARKSTTWDTPAHNGETGAAAAVEMTHTNDLDWTSVAASEDYTHCTYWTAASAGTFGGSGEITAAPVVVGNNFSLPAETLIVRQPVAG